MEERDVEEWLKNLPVQSENIGFRAEDMFPCADCERLNPPTRLNCLYCGVELEISEERSRFLRPVLRKPELWEKGFNVILSPVAQTFDESKIAEIAPILKIEPDVLRKIVETGTPLPVARADSEKEAEIVRQCLKNFGLESFVINDEHLDFEKTPRRLRGIEFFDDNLILILFNQDEIVEIRREDLFLIVAGTIYERRVEATEARGKKGENKILDTTEIASDEAVIDLYSRADAIGWRILAKGFDFSCLEESKEILAKDNIVKLVEKLRLFAPEAKFVGDYPQIRELLAGIWEVEQKSESQGFKRGGIGKFNVGSATMVSNAAQFTKYSRLRRSLL